MNFKKTMMAVVVAAPLAAFAQTGTTVKPAPVLPTEAQLACPTGTKQSGGKDTVFEATFCTKAGRLGEPLMHGPYLGLYKSGKKRVEGAYLEGKRTGLWIAYAADEWLRGLLMWRRWVGLGWVPHARAARRRVR